MRLELPTLCVSCRHKRDILSGKGSRFLLCELALSDARFAKYPSQPILRCSGFLLAGEETKSAPSDGDAN